VDKEIKLRAKAEGLAVKKFFNSGQVSSGVFLDIPFHRTLLSPLLRINCDNVTPHNNYSFQQIELDRQRAESKNPIRGRSLLAQCVLLFMRCPLAVWRSTMSSVITII
jgi:hypothetical protein